MPSPAPKPSPAQLRYLRQVRSRSHSRESSPTRRICLERGWLYEEPSPYSPADPPTTRLTPTGLLLAQPGGSR